MNPKTFEEAVQLLSDAGESNRTVYSVAMKKFPKLYQAHTNRIFKSSGSTEKLADVPHGDEDADWLTLVSEYRQ